MRCFHEPPCQYVTMQMTTNSYTAAERETLRLFNYCHPSSTCLTQKESKRTHEVEDHANLIKFMSIYAIT